MTRLRVVHLVDDTTAGGVMRVIDHITTSPELARTAAHSLRVVARGSLGIGRINADVIVSHLSVSWRNLPMFIALRAANARSSLVHVEHSYTECFVALNVTHRKRFATLLRTTYALFDRVVAVSHAQGQWLSARGYARADALHVIQSCTDMSAFRQLETRKGPVRVIGAIGRLDRQKGFDTLVAAFRNCPHQNIALHIYGEGSEEETLRRMAQNDERIRFMGFASDPVKAMAAVDAVVMPSRWEAYGLVAIEALSAGRDLLVNAVDGLKDHEMRGALVVPNPSVRAWRNAICNLTEASPCDTPVLDKNRVGDAPEIQFATLWHNLLGSLTAKTVRQF